VKDKKERKYQAILNILAKTDHLLSSSKITEQLRAQGYDISERTVRYYLSMMKFKGHIESDGKKGCIITEPGIKETQSCLGIEKVGFLSARIDQMTYRMNFNLAKRSGTVVVNVSLLDSQSIQKGANLIANMFREQYSMGRLIGLFPPLSKLGDLTIPRNMFGIGTVCSITLNGVMLSHGIPTVSRFGGILEIKEKKPTRFTEIIMYEGTSLDPIEIFIKSRMTDYIGVATTGNGRIVVGFREFPADSRDKIIELAGQLESAGLGKFMMVGWPSQPLLDIPVSEGRIGAIIVGGLNPLAILEESKLHLSSRAMSGVVEYDTLFPYSELEERVKAASSIER